MLDAVYKSTNDREVLIPCGIALLKSDPEYVPKCRDPVADADGGKEIATFQQAYEAAVARYPREWTNLIPSRIIQAIYEEMRRIDAEAAGAMVDVHLSEHKSKGPDKSRRRTAV